MRHYHCRCGNVLFFDNSLCLQCGAQIGYDEATDQMVSLDVDAPFRRCKNGIDYAVCNWVAPAGAADPFCRACGLNRIIPALSVPGNLDAWHKIEIAKRRILYALARLGLFPVSKREDPVNGLAFDFLRPDPGKIVLTGHDEGIITLNAREAEDVERERQRDAFGESYRTLIGHFRHEVAHYYWDRFFKDMPDDDQYLMGFREIFGDEREDYDAALARHYSNPAPAPAGKYISAYASVHPWEDWAETWAHYLHITDGIETAENFGVSAESVPIPFTHFPGEASALPAGLMWTGDEQNQFLARLEAWAKLVPALNEIVAGLGHQAFYPFVFSVEIVRKLSFVHYMMLTKRAGSMEIREQAQAA